MTSRRNLIIMMAGSALLAACDATPGRSTTVVADPSPAGPLPAVPDVLVVESRRGLVVLGPGRSEGLGPAASVSPDASSIYAAAPNPAGGTTLTSVVPATGARTDRGVLPGNWVPRVVSADGRYAALTDRAPEPGGGRPAARDRTALLVVAPDGGQRRWELPGVVEPDAFTTDGTGLFVLQWLPASAPDRYRVRLLDLASGVLQPLLTRAKSPVPPGAEEEMRGAGRQSVLSADRQLLYTLYTHQADHRHTRDLLAGRPGGVHAFVHVLHLTERWAYCLDLPHPFGQGPAAGHAMALSADGRRLAVVDLTSGSLAFADPAALTVQRVVRVPAGPGAASLALGATGQRLFVGAGRTVTVVDQAADSVTARWPVPGEVSGLGLNRDGTRLHVGGADEVVWLDAASGDIRGRVPVAGLTALRHVG